MKVVKKMSRARTWSVLCACCVLMWSGCPPEDPSSNNSPGNNTTTPTVTTPGNNANPDMSDPVEMAPPLPPGADVTVASFNVQRLFDTKCNSGRCDAGDFEEVYSELTLKGKVERIQAAIEKLDADVIVFQEIETQDLLEQVMEPYGATYPTQVFGETGFSASLDVAIVSKGSLISTTDHRNERFQLANGDSERFAREYLEVEVDVRGARVVAFGAHFISKRSDSDGDRRLGEAKQAAKIAAEVAEQQPNALVVIAGDLNDTPDSAPILAMESAGFVVTARTQDLETHYTHVFSGDKAVLDHVLYYDRDDIVVGGQGLEVMRDEGRSGFGGSDHAAPRLRMRLVE